MAFIKNDKGISESVDNNFSNYQLMNDSNERLKTYKIKNHGSGKTYRVRAVNYTDAKNKYNKHILKDADKSMGTYNGYSIKQNAYGDIYVLKKSGEKEFFESWKKAYEAIKSGAIKDSLTEDIESASERESRSHWKNFPPGTRVRHKKLGLGTVYRRSGGSLYVDFDKGGSGEFYYNGDLELVKDSLTEDGYSELQQQVKQLTNRLKIKTNLGVSINKQTKQVMLFAYNTKQANQWIDKLRAANYKAYLHRESGNVHVAKFIMPELKTDSIIEDTLTKVQSNKLYKLLSKLDKYDLYEIVYGGPSRGSIGQSKRELLDDAFYTLVDKSLTDINRALRDYNLKLDSITEDADLTGKIMKYKGMKVKVLRKLTEQEKQRRAYAANPDAGDYYEVEATSKELGTSKYIVWEARLRDSITEDADIAQTDIKSTYLPEDANADNIQYLGFNEKRKLSFYSYGDRYFVHHDLEGRTEEIDKETVQKILKKNILGEIDENDLINKEPQSEEIVTDSADWTKKQERGDE